MPLSESLVGGEREPLVGGEQEKRVGDDEEVPGAQEESSNFAINLYWLVAVPCIFCVIVAQILDNKRIYPDTASEFMSVGLVSFLLVGGVAFGKAHAKNSLDLAAKRRDQRCLHVLKILATVNNTDPAKVDDVKAELCEKFDISPDFYEQFVRIYNASSYSERQQLFKVSSSQYAKYTYSPLIQSALKMKIEDDVSTLFRTLF